MTQINLYIEVLYLGRVEDGEGKYAALLEYIRENGEPETREISGKLIHTTKNRVYLHACIKALERLRKSCEITVYTNNFYMTESISRNRCAEWRAAGWQRADGSPLKNADMWKRIADLSANHLITAAAERHSCYTGVLRHGLMKKEFEPEEDRKEETNAEGDTPHCISKSGRAELPSEFDRSDD